MRTLLRAFAFSFLAAFVAGCSPKECEVFGTVSYDGQPVKQGGITFTPTDGKSPTAGAMIQDGRYSCKLPPGEHKVSINGSKTVERKLYGDAGPAAAMTSELLPPKYHQQTELKYDAQPGKHEKNWELAK